MTDVLRFPPSQKRKCGVRTWSVSENYQTLVSHFDITVLVSHLRVTGQKHQQSGHFPWRTPLELNCSKCCTACWVTQLEKLLTQTATQMSDRIFNWRHHFTRRLSRPFLLRLQFFPQRCAFFNAHIIRYRAEQRQHKQVILFQMIYSFKEKSVLYNIRKVKNWKEDSNLRLIYFPTHQFMIYNSLELNKLYLKKLIWVTSETDYSVNNKYSNLFQNQEGKKLCFYYLITSLFRTLNKRSWIP